MFGLHLLHRNCRITAVKTTCYIIRSVADLYEDKKSFQICLMLTPTCYCLYMVREIIKACHDRAWTYIGKIWLASRLNQILPNVCPVSIMTSSYDLPNHIDGSCGIKH